MSSYFTVVYTIYNRNLSCSKIWFCSENSAQLNLIWSIPWTMILTLKFNLCLVCQVLSPSHHHNRNMKFLQAIYVTVYITSHCDEVSNKYLVIKSRFSKPVSFFIRPLYNLPYMRLTGHVNAIFIGKGWENFLKKGRLILKRLV